MANQGRINFGVGFNVDKTGLNELRASLQSIQNLTPKEILSAKNINDARAKLNSVKESAKTVESALAASFNPKLNTYNIDKFNKTLQGSGITLQNLKSEWEGIGATGKKSFNDLTNAITAAKLPLEETHNLLKSMGVTLANTIKWSVASSAINSLTGSVQKAWSFTRQLDESLNNIMIVTGKSSDQMAAFARQANSAAKALGSTTKAYTDAALIYYQQGLGESDVAARAGVTIKAANVTGQSAETVSEQLTAVWNGYKVSAQEAEVYIDKLAAVAASTAADLEELSVGMSQVASAANIMGVDIDQLNAQLATIVSVTREAPETIGTALKTVYARMSDIESGLDTETTLGAYTSEMAEFGIRVLDGNNKLRDMGEVVEEIGNKWSTFSREQRVALAQTVAGTRQYARMMSLFENWEMYQQALETSADSVGTLAEQEEIYLESIEAHMNKMTASAENLYMQIFNPEGVTDLYSLLSGLIDLGADFVESLGGGGKMLLAALPLIAKLLSGPVSSGLATFVTNLQTAEQKSLTLKSVLENIASVKAVNGLKAYQDRIAELRKQITLLANAGVITNAQYNELTETLTQLSESASEEDFGEEASKKAEAKILQYQTVFEAEGGTLDYNKLRKQGQEFASTGRDAKTDQSWQTGEYEKFNKVLNSTKEKIDKLKKSSEKAFESIKDNFVGGNQKAKAFSDQLTTIDKEINKLTDAKGLTGGDLRSVNAQRKKLEAALNGTSVDGKRTLSTKERQKNIDDAIAALRSKLGSAADAVIKEVERMSKQVGKDAQGATEEISQGVEAGLYSFEQRIKKLNLEQSINKVINFTSNVGMAISAVSLLAEQKDIWTNEDLTIGEKITQSLMNFTSAAGMLLPIIQSLHAWYTSYVATTSSGIAVTNLSTIAEKLRNEEIKDSIQWDNLLKEATDGVSDELRKQILALQANTAEWDKNTAAKKLNELINEQDKKKPGFFKASIDKVKTGFKDFGDGAKAAAKAGGAKNISAALAAGGAVGTGGAGASLGASLVALGPILLAVVAAIAAISAGIAGTISIIKEEEKALEKATEAAEHAATKYQETQNAWESLQNSISSYQNAKKSIEELTQGTIEWREAIHTVNNEVLNLLEKYPELNAYLTRDIDTGALSIRQIGLEKVQEAQLQEVSNARSRSLLTQQAKLNAEFNLKQKELTDTLIYGSESMADFVDAYTVALNVFTLGIGGTSLQAGLDSYEDNYAENLIQYFDLYATGLHDDMFTSVEAFAKAINETTNSLTSSELNLAEKLVENSKEVSALAEEYRANRQAKATRLEELGYEILGDTDATRGEAYATGKYATDRQSEIYEELRDELGGNAFDKKVAEKYAEIMGYDANTIDTSGHNVFTLEIDSKRSDAIDLATAYSEMAAELARQEAAGKTAAKAVKTFTSSFGNLSKEAINALSTLVEGADLVDYSKLTLNDFETISQLDTSSEAFKTLAENIGVSAQELIKWHDTEIEYIDTELSEVISSLPPEIKASFNTILSDTGDLTLSVYQTFGETYTEIWERFGAEGLAAISKVMVAAGDKADNLLVEISEIDWAADDIKENIQNVLDELGLSIDIDIVDNYIEQMQYLNGVYGMSRDKMHEVAASIEDILDDLKIGDIIKKEDYKNLELYLGDLSDKFIQLFDGSYQLIDSNISLVELEQERRRKAAKANINAKNQEVDDAYAAKNKKNSAETQRKLASVLEEAMQGDFIKVDENGKLLYNNLTEDEFIDAIVNSSAYTNLMPGVDKETARAGLKSYISYEGYSYDQLSKIVNTYNEMYQAAWLSTPEGQETNKLITEAAKLEREVADLGYQGKTSDEILESAKKLKEGLPDLYKDYLATALTFDEIVAISQEAKDKGVELEGSDLLKEVQRLGQSIFKTIEDTGNLSADQLYQYFEKAWNDAVDAGKIQGEKIEDISDLSKESIKDVSQIVTKSLKALIKGTQDLDRAIEDVEEELENLENEFDNAIGLDAFKNLNNQIDALQEGLDLTEEKLKRIQSQGISNTSVAVDTFFTDMQKAGFDVAGFNRESLTNALIDSEGNINQEVVDQLREWSITFAAQGEEGGKTIVDSLLTYLNNYEQRVEEANKAIAEGERKLLEANFKRYEDILKRATIGFEFARKISDLEKEFISENDHRGLVGAYQEDIIISKNFISSYEDSLNNLNEMRAAGQISDKQWATEYENILNKLYDEQSNILKSIQSIDKERLNTLNDISEAYQEQISHLEQINALLEISKNVIKLTYGENAHSMLQSYYGNVLANTEKIAQSTKNSFDAAAKKYKPDSAEWLSLSEEEREKIEQEYLETGRAYAEAMYSVMEARQADYLNNIEVALDNFRTKIYGEGTDVDLLRKQWEWAKSSSEDYYDSVQRLYKLEDLALEFDKIIYDTKDIKTQQRINNLKEDELKYLKSLDKLSEYDVKRAQQKLEILQAQIALEDAQFSKTQMRLMRGADGTYSYQYVADENKIAKAQDALREAQSALYDLDLEAYTSSIDKFSEALIQLEDLIRELGEDGYTEEELSFIQKRWEEVQNLAVESERINKKHLESMTNAASTFGANLTEISQGTIVSLTSDIDSIINKVATNGIEQSYETLMSKLLSLSNKYIIEQKQTADTLKDVITGTDGQSGLIGAYDQFATKQEAVINNLEREYSQLPLTAQKYSELKTAVSELADEYSRLAQAQAAIVEKELDFSSTFFHINPETGNRDWNGDGKIDIEDFYALKNTGWATGSTEWENINSFDDYKTYYENVDKASVNKSLQYNWEQYEKRKDHEQSSSSGESTLNINPINQSPEEDDFESNSNDQEDTDKNFYDPYQWAGKRLKFTSNKISYYPLHRLEGNKISITSQEVNGAKAMWADGLDYQGGNDGTAHLYVTTNGGLRIYEDKNGNKYIQAHTNDKYDALAYVPLDGLRLNEWINYKKKEGGNKYDALKGDSFINLLKSYDTGGYTGEWGDSSGRLAMLHEKEIVLNKVDTANILKAVDIVRSLETSMLNGLAQMSFGYNIPSTIWEMLKDTAIEQNVHITAEFPNVSTKNEIEEAFNDLIDLAIQHVHSNKK